MEQNKIDAFIASNGKFFPADKTVCIVDNLENLPDVKYGLISNQKFINSGTTTVLSVLLGLIGVDRFMLGDTGLGVLKLLTFGGCGIWWFIDWFLVGKTAKMKNFEKVSKFF